MGSGVGDDLRVGWIRICANLDALEGVKTLCA